MQDFRELKVWQKAHALTLRVYRDTRAFPASELYGLTRQIRRATASIGANIAEGTGRNSSPDFARFLQMALGSASEVEYHMILASDLEYLNPGIANEIIENTQEIKRMLTSLIQRVRAPKT